MLAPSPLVRAERLHEEGWIKVESMLPTGSFKPRGAIAALAAVPGNQRLVVSSAGNAAIAVAWAARRLGRRASIVVPETASPAKLGKLAHLGVPVQRHGTSFDEAERWALGLAREQPQLYYLSSYNDTHFIAGLATIGAEIGGLAGPMTIVCPVGGGGLISGICSWAATRPDITIVGVQAAASPAMGAAVHAGHIVTVPVAPTLAEGLAGNIEPGSVTFDIVRRRVDQIVDVTEDEIAEAMRFLAFEHGLVSEGAGAVATAGLLAGRVRPTGTAVCILSGANISAQLLSEVLVGR